VRTLLIVLLYAALVLTLHIAGVLAPVPANWGVHHYAFLPGVWLWGGVLGAVLLGALVWGLARRSREKPAKPGSREKPAKPGSRKEPAKPGSRVPGILLGLLIAVAGAALFWLGRERTTFMGGQLLGAPDSGFARVGVSAACGVIYLLLAFSVARVVASDLGGRLVVFGLLALAGVTRLFYGYVETFPLLAVAAMLYLALGVRALGGRGGFWPVAVVASVAPFAHVTGAFLWPSLVYLLWVGGRAEANSPAPASPRRPRLLLLLIPLAALAVGVILRGGVGSFATLVAAYPHRVLPLSGPLGLHVPYTLFSSGHFGDILQEQWLIGPFGALLAIAVLAFRAHGGLRREERFLLWAGGPWWLASILFRRDLGAAREWDLFAVASLPWLLLLGMLLARAPWRAERPRSASAAVGLLLALSFFHTLPWVAVDTEVDRSLAHFAALYGPGSGASRFARSYAFEEIGTWYLDRGQSESAVVAYREAATLDTTNTRVIANLGAVLLAQGKRDEAASVLELAVRRDPNLEFAQYQLGNVYRDQGRAALAASSYRKALALNPDFLQATLNYAAMERQQGNLVIAEAILVDALKRAPDSADLKAHLGRVQEDKGDTASAAVNYREAVTRNPDDTASAFNLGYLLMRQGKTEEASRYFEMVVERSPTDAEAWINLGVARDLEGSGAAARTAFERAIVADPRRPEPYFNLAQGYLAAKDTTGAARVLRSYAAIDSTSNMGVLARRLLASMGGRGGR
jgi:Tfp pilus assembly protein PilF